MGKCSNCGKKILYNSYKMYRGKILCPECYDTRLERKAEKKAELKRKAKLNELVTPTKKAEKASKKVGLTTDFKLDDVDDDTGKTAEDTR